MSGVGEELDGYAVAGGRATFTLTPALRLTGYLDDVRETSSDLLVTTVLDRPVIGGPLYMSAIGRQISYYENYVADVRVDTQNRVRIGLSKNIDRETNSPISEYLVLPGEIAPGDVISIRIQVFGTSPTTVRAKAWFGEQDEPADWIVSKVEDDPQLQKAGGVGFTTYLSQTASNPPMRVSLLEIAARPVVQ